MPKPSSNDDSDKLRDGIGNVVPEAGNVGKAQVENLRVVLLGEIENSLGVSHGGSLPAEA